MLFPRLFDEDLFDDDLFELTSRPMFGKHEKNWMKTDVKDLGSSYELDMDLPGFKREDVHIELDQGMLTISAERNHENDEKDDQGNYVRRERRYGSCSRSFYVGEDMKHEDIKAKYEDGILYVTLPKVDQKAVETKKTIAIE